MTEFKYFKDPHKFAFLSEEEVECDICKKTEICFDAGGYFGEEEIDHICGTCLADGALIQLDICANDIEEDDITDSLDAKDKTELINTITYKTPGLPTWQELEWPVIDGEPAVFIKLASKVDFDNNFSTFEKALHDNEIDPKELWNSLSNKQITSLADGNNNTSFYLFDSKGKQIVLWDCN